MAICVLLYWYESRQERIPMKYIANKQISDDEIAEKTCMRFCVSKLENSKYSIN